MQEKLSSQVKFSTIFARLGQSAVILGILGILLFAGAGRLDWWEAWVFLAFYFTIAASAAIWMLYHDPDLSAERSRVGKNQKPWDKVLVTLNLLLTLVLWAFIGLDAGRLGWSSVPLVIRITAAAALLSSFGLTLWASSVNTFLSGQVRIQTERGHHAVTQGPYHYIRHPMYVSMILSDICIPLLLGSSWGLAISALMILVVIMRTALEDRTLRTELDGYAEYARQVRYRLLPGVW